MEKIRDYDIREGMGIDELVRQAKEAGFQGTKIGEAIDAVRRMKEEGATIFLSFTANMVASGLRGIFAELVRRKSVDVIVTTGGAIEHDLIRAYKPYLIGDFGMDDSILHKKGINRIGNILVPNDRYVLLERKLKPILEGVYTKGKITTPRDLIFEIGKSIRDRNSFTRWASANNIPIFCPGITDSAIGLQVYFFKQAHRDFVIDVTGDMLGLGSIVLNAEKTGGIILGGGIAKHHTIGANILRGGLDYAVYVTTAQPWDGSLSGARTNEAVSWGKIKEKADHVTVDGDATVIFPLIAPALMGSSR
jgi:deoxyhypusine synthase